MATIYSPRKTRSQTASGISPAETATLTPEAEILHTILRELGRLREEQKTDRETMQTELRRLESQLSHYNNISAIRDGACEVGSHEGSCRE